MTVSLSNIRRNKYKTWQTSLSKYEMNKSSTNTNIKYTEKSPWGFNPTQRMIENWRKQSTGGVGIPRKNTSNHCYQKASQETIYTGIIIQNEQVIFMNMCICVCTHRRSKIQSLRITIKKRSWIMAQRRWLKWEVFKGGMGMEKGCN